MISGIREWLSSVIAVTLLVTVAQKLIPEGAIRKIAAFISGLILLVALLKPLLNLKIVDLSEVLSEYTLLLETQEEKFGNITKEEWRFRVEEMTAVHIEEYAAKQGIVATVIVDTEFNENDIPIPTTISINGDYHEAVAAWIETEIGVPKQQQHWEKSTAP